MASIDYFEHTADVGMRINAATLDDLFSTAAKGLMAYVVANLQDVEASDWETFDLKAETWPDLLAMWLNELIFRVETNHRLYADFQVQSDAQECRLVARIGGQAIDPDRHILDHEVKAATHHGLRLERKGVGWLAEVVLDI